MTVDDDSAGVLLVIGSGRRPYREYLLDGASQRRPLWLIDQESPSWQLPYLAGSSVVAPLHDSRFTANLPGLIEAAMKVTASRSVCGVFTYDESLVIATAHIAERLGLPGLTSSGAERCRNKYLTRKALTAAGVLQPRFALTATVAEAGQAAMALGYPVVLKPQAMAASMGVSAANSPAALPAAFALAQRAARSGPVRYEAGILVEELVDGPEISIDGAVVDGDYLPFCVAHKTLGRPPYFEETGHIVCAADPLLGDVRLREVLSTAHRALGVRHGITHTEVRMSSVGPVVIEVNARLGGDFIPYLGLLACGVDPGRAAAEVAAGSRPALEPARACCAGIRFLYPPEDCRVAEVTVPVAGTVPGLQEARPLAEPGTTLRLPPRGNIERYAYVICTADEPTACASRLAEAAGLVELTHEALNELQPTVGHP